MTNDERDKLLISIATSVNDIRSDLRQTDERLTNRINEVDEKLTNKIEEEAKATAEIFTDRWVYDDKRVKDLDSKIEANQKRIQNLEMRYA